MDYFDKLQNETNDFFDEAKKHSKKLERLHEVLIELDFNESEIEKITKYMGHISKRRNSLLLKIKRRILK